MCGDNNRAFETHDDCVDVFLEKDLLDNFSGMVGLLSMETHTPISPGWFDGMLWKRIY